MWKEIERIEDLCGEFGRLVGDIEGMRNEMVKIIEISAKRSNYVVFAAQD